MSTWTDAELFALDPPRVRADAFRFELLDVALNVIGELHPDRDSPPEIALDTSSGVPRTMTGMRLTPAETAGVNALADRLRPVAVLQNGSTFPLGVFLFTDDPRKVRSFGTYVDSCTFGDQFVQVNQPIPEGVAFPAGTSYTDALTSVVQAAGIVSFSVEYSVARLAEPIAFELGRNRAEVIAALTSSAGWVAYFANDGTFTARTPPDPGTTPAAFAYGAGGVVVESSIAETDDLLAAPNEWIVVSTSARTSPVVGRYVLPASAPHSETQRGFSIPKVIQQQGIATAADANAAARAAAFSTDAGFERVQFSAAADFRHDSYDVVEWESEPFLESGWRLRLSSGGQMQHSLRRAYS